MTDDLYQEVLLEEFAHPKFFGKMSDADLILPGVNPSCGDALMIYIKLDTTGKKITHLTWDGEGCAISVAAMSILAQKINSQEMSIAEVLEMKKSDLEESLGLEDILSGRVKCLMLGLSTLQKGLQGSLSKNFTTK